MGTGPRAAVVLAVATSLPACRDRADRRPLDREGQAEAPRAPGSSDSAPADSRPVVLPEPPPLARAPRGLPPIPSPGHNPTTAEKVELGRLLFFDPRLSASGKTSCASCHAPERGWADGVERAPTDGGQPNLRHTPSLYNVGYHREWAWDGAMPSLEAHVLSHWKGQLAGRPERADSLLGAPGYVARFARAFRARPGREDMAEALAAFTRTVVSGDSPWDRHEAGVSSAVPPDAVAGFRIFGQRAGCATCHPPPLYTDRDHHDRGLGASRLAQDPGRMRVTTDPRHLGAFKTPGLRGLAHTAPYFHDGSAATLAAAVDTELARSQVSLTVTERDQLLAFLRALSPPVEGIARPELPSNP